MFGKEMHNVRYALNGVRIAWQEEFNFRVQVFAMVLAIVVGWFFGISRVEWLIVILAIGIVLAAEAFNTALEELCDKFKTDPDPHIAKIKDLAAGAVLIASTAAFVVGFIIFVPRFFSLV